MRNHQRAAAYREPVDMRKSFDTLTALVAQGMPRDVTSGEIYELARGPSDAHSTSVRMPLARRAAVPSPRESFSGGHPSAPRRLHPVSAFP